MPTEKLSNFAARLPSPMPTVKRLFGLGILPANLIHKTAGGHWLVTFTLGDLKRCRAILAVWKVFRRKPNAAKDPARVGEIQIRLLNLLTADKAQIGKATTPTKPASTKQAMWTVPEMESHASRLRSFQRHLSTTNKQARDRQALKLRDLLLARPNEVAGFFILMTEVAAFQARWKVSPTRKELAVALGVSERALYRAPFGRAVLTLAFSDIEIPARRRKHVESDKDGDGETENYIAESEADPGPEERRANANKFSKKERRRPASGRTRDDGTGRRLKKIERRDLEIDWERGKQASQIVLYARKDLKRKRQLHELEQLSNPRGRAAEALRKLLSLRAADPTFGGWCAGYCSRDADGVWGWQLNFEPCESGHSKSREEAECEIREHVEAGIMRRRVREQAGFKRSARGGKNATPCKKGRAAPSTATIASKAAPR